MSVEKCSRSRWRGDELLEARLPDRDPPRFRPSIFVRVDVDAPDLVAQLGETRRGDQADVAGADDADRLAFSAHAAGEATSGPRPSPAQLAEPLQRAGDAEHRSFAATA